MALTKEQKQEILAESIALLNFELEFVEMPGLIRIIKERQLKTANKQFNEMREEK